MTFAMSVLVASTVSTALACGATLDQTFKQLPARHQIGATAYVASVRAADLRNGLIWPVGCPGLPGLADDPGKTLNRFARFNVIRAVGVAVTLASSV